MAIIYINGKSIADFDGELLAGYTVSGSPLENVYQQGKNRTSFVLMSTTIGLKTITLPVVYHGSSHAEILQNKSAFDGLCYGKSELQFPDGVCFTVMPQDTGTPEWAGQCLAQCTYIFEGLQHGPMITVTDSRIYCMSTMPQTDCLLRVTACTSGRYQLGGAIFTNVNVGDRLTFDGINKRILINNGPAAHRCEWINFPALKPGWNTISAADPVTIQYYPCYL